MAALFSPRVDARDKYEIRASFVLSAFCRIARRLGDVESDGRIRQQYWETCGVNHGRRTLIHDSGILLSFKILESAIGAFKLTCTMNVHCVRRGSKLKTKHF